MQHEMKKGPLLDKNGNLAEPGFSTSLVKDYFRKDIKACSLKIKEWDYYYVGNDDYGFATTVADNSYMSMISVSFIDFKQKKDITKSKIGLFSCGKLNLPSSSKSGDVIFSKNGYVFKYLHEEDRRHIIVEFPNFDCGKKLLCDLILSPTNKDSMVIATPFNKNGHFYYNQKINLLEGRGSVIIGEKKYEFDKDSYGVLDWGRGVWTYKNTWYWSSLNAIYKGKRIGFNLGYGFGDTSQASENMLFYDDRAYKLDDVIFNIPLKNNKFDYMSPWTFNSKNGDINLKFTPILNRHANLNIGILKSVQNQVFGYFSGTIKYENKEVSFENLLGFAERVTNHW